MKVVSLIPARVGSKGLENKNFRPFCGTNLFLQAIKVSLNSQLINETFVSTDSKEMHNLAQSYGAKATGLRNVNLSQDETPIFEVAIDFINSYNLINRSSFDVFVLLEPTSPLRTPKLVDTAIQSLLNNYDNLDGVNTFGKMNFGIDSLFTLKKNTPIPILDGLDPGRNRQNQESLYFPFGIAYCIKKDTLVTEKTFYPRRLGASIVREEFCLEIDSYNDFSLAENIFMQKQLLL